MKNKILIIIFVIIAILFCIFVLYKFKLNGNESAAIKLYNLIIDETLKNDLGNNYEYLSIYLDKTLDPLNKKELSDYAKKEILKYEKKYNEVIYDKSKDELLSVNNDTTHNLNGIYISISTDVNSLSHNKAIINVVYSVGRQNSNMRNYLVEYSNNSWKISKILLDVR